MKTKASLAGFGIFLLISLPFTQATTLNIIYDGFSPVPVILPDIVDGLKQGQITAKKNGQDYSITISLSLNQNFYKRSKQTLQTLYLYPCKSLDLLTCTKTVQPQSYPFDNKTTLDLSLPWSSLRDGATYPQTGNILIVMKTNNPTPSFVSSWHRLVRETSNDPPVHFTTDIGSADITVPRLEDRDIVKNFIEQTAMIPASNIESILFTQATTIAELSSDSPPPFSAGQKNTNELFPPLPRLYDIVFPQSSQQFNGVSLIQNAQGYICGDSVCTSAPNGDESASTCCYDCGCPSGQYCDLSLGCKPLSEVSLEIIPPTDTHVSNCNQQHTIMITARLNNPPSDLAVLSQRATIDGTQKFSISCSFSGDAYSCPVPVPPEPNCDEGSFVYSDNSLTFDISYTDGQSSQMRSLTTPFPDITIGSWMCGDARCDSSLGENSANCCYDCPCASGQYCDIAIGGDVKSGQCRAEPSDTSISLFNISPTSFLSYTSTGNKITFSYSLSPPPQSLTLGVESCSTTCISDTECSAPCSVSCTKDDNEASCSLSFTIVNYNNLKSYSVRPLLTVPFTYYNGPSRVSTSISSLLPLYAFGPFFCGDLTCNSPDETVTNCCFDCGCPVGQYCSTLSTDTSSPTDMCIADSLQLVIDRVTPISFTDQRSIHTVNISAHIENIPAADVQLRGNPYSCSLWGGSIDCTLQCRSFPRQGSSRPLECEITLPSITYPDASSFILSPNSLSVIVDYNNASTVSRRILRATLPDLSITQTAHCGFDSCETYLGESAANCCIDCPCRTDPSFGSTYVCAPGGTEPASQCVPSSSISVVVQEMHPDPLTCMILPPQGGGGCTFVDSLIFDFTVLNAPSSFKIIDSSKDFDGNITHIDCLPFIAGNNTFRCFFQMPKIEEKGPPGPRFSSISPGEESKHIRFIFDTSYTDNKQIVTTKMGTSTNFTIFKDGSQIQSCQEQAENMDGKIDKHERNNNIINTFLYFVWGVVVVEAIRCGLCQIPWGKSECPPLLGLFPPTSCTSAKSMGIIAACVTSVLLPFKQQTEGAISKAKAEREAVCAAPDQLSLNNAVDGLGDSSYIIAQGVTTLVCLIGVFAGGLSSGSSATSASSTSQGSSQLGDFNPVKPATGGINV